MGETCLPCTLICIIFLKKFNNYENAKIILKNNYEIRPIMFLFFYLSRRKVYIDKTRRVMYARIVDQFTFYCLFDALINAMISIRLLFLFAW